MNPGESKDLGCVKAPMGRGVERAQPRAGGKYYHDASQKRDVDQLFVATCPRARQLCGLAFRAAIFGQKLTTLRKRRCKTSVLYPEFAISLDGFSKGQATGLLLEQ